MKGIRASVLMEPRPDHHSGGCSSEKLCIASFLTKTTRSFDELAVLVAVSLLYSLYSMVRFL
jgi:hypothetical protein